jgi:enterochelin esterase family protein
MPPPRLRAGEIVFTLDDEERALRAVRLAQDVERPRVGPEFRRRGTRWTLRLPRPDVDRLEYQLALTHTDGSERWICDPDNPLRADGPFGEKSVVELPGYRAPAWLEADPRPGRLDTVRVRCRGLRAHVEIPVWTSAGASADAELPLLVVHDGPEMAEYAGLLRFLDTAVGEEWLPPMRAALVPPPGDRDESYSAAALYARSLATDVLPALPVPTERRLRACMGASLGALAAFHAHRMRPETFGALFLQSGSFFRRSDRHEAAFKRFARITRFMTAVHTGRAQGTPIPVTMTCGTVEENLRSNEALAETLAAQGYSVELHVLRDAHNWVGWRDAFDPHLLNLLGGVWS